MGKSELQGSAKFVIVLARKSSKRPHQRFQAFPDITLESLSLPVDLHMMSP